METEGEAGTQRKTQKKEKRGTRNQKTGKQRMEKKRRKEKIERKREGKGTY